MRVTTRGWHFLKPSHRATSCMGATESIVLWPCFPLLDFPHHSQLCRPTRFAVVVATSSFAFRCSSYRRTCALPGRRARYRIVGIARLPFLRVDALFRALTAAPPPPATAAHAHALLSAVAIWPFRQTCGLRASRVVVFAQDVHVCLGESFAWKHCFLCVCLCVCVSRVCVVLWCGFLVSVQEHAILFPACLAAFARCISLFVFRPLSLCDGLAPGQSVRP